MHHGEVIKHHFQDQFLLVCVSACHASEMHLGKMINCSDLAKKIFACLLNDFRSWKLRDMKDTWWCALYFFFVRCEKFLFISVPISGCVRTGGGGEKEEKLCERSLKDALLHWLEQFHISLEHRILFRRFIDISEKRARWRGTNTEAKKRSSRLRLQAVDPEF